MQEGEEQQIYQLIVRVFYQQVAPVYSANGITRFLNMLSPQRLTEMNNGEDSFVIIARDQSRLAGILSVINNSHIALIFVEPSYQGKGIGKQLIAQAIKLCRKRKPEISEITVSSSPNSRSFYEDVGFETTDNEINEAGMRYTPMKKLLWHKNQ